MNYEIFENTSNISSVFKDDHPKYRIRQIVVYRIAGTNKWIWEKRVLVGNDRDRLIKDIERTPEPKVFKFKYKAYDFGAPYKEDDRGDPIGEWPDIAELKVETDCAKVIFDKDLTKYDLFDPCGVFFIKINKGYTITGSLLEGKTKA